MPKTTNKIKYESFLVYSNWCYHICLGGIKLMSKDVIVLQWPNGATQRIHPRVVESSYQDSDMGTPCTIPTTKAYIDIEHEGATIAINLANVKGLKGYFVTDISDRKPMA
jgi:hypothetical protein